MAAVPKLGRTLAIIAATAVLPLVLGSPPSAFGQGLDEAADELTERIATGFGEDPRGLEALDLLSRNRLIRARELAETMLRENPDDFAGHFVLGVVLHRAEGSLPRALFHLQRGREILEARFGPEPNFQAPWRWHALTLAELAFVAGSMGLHEEKIQFLEDREALYQPPWPAEKGWPLMRLRRYDEARAAAEEGLALDDLDQHETARTALCAVEAELHRRAAAYDACLAAASLARDRGPRGPTTFTNAAEAALGMLRLDEAERLIVEGTGHFASPGVSNPWLDLTVLYLGQARLAEALDGLREMLRWQRRQPVFIDVQNRSEIDMTAAAFLIAAGRYEKAAEVTARVRERPDRTGFTSSEENQMTAAAAILDQLANRLRAEALDEEASWSAWRDAVGLRLTAARHRVRAWLSSRRAAALVAHPRTLVATLRPYLAGSVEMPEWFEGELVEVLGPGVVGTALAEARAAEDLLGAGAYFDAFDAEIALARGRTTAAMDLAELAAQGLPSSELLMQARLMAIGARAALDAGLRARAIGFLDRAWQLDPGIVRRFDLALPTRIDPGEGGIARRAAKLLRGSPRFTAAEGGFRIAIEGSGQGGEACLLGPRGSVLACAQVTPRAGDDEASLARRLVAELHEAVFAPRVDLTQADLRTLDGSPTAAGRSGDRIRSVLDDVVE